MKYLVDFSDFSARFLASDRRCACGDGKRLTAQRERLAKEQAEAIAMQEKLVMYLRRYRSSK